MVCPGNICLLLLFSTKLFRLLRIKYLHYTIFSIFYLMDGMYFIIFPYLLDRFHVFTTFFIFYSIDDKHLTVPIFLL